MWLEIFLICIFIFVNGFFAASEIAVVTMRRSRIKKLVEEGVRNAETLGHLREHPDRFFATIQIGVTAAGALASAIAGAAAVETISPIIRNVPVSLISVSSDAIAIGIVVLFVTYFSLMFGELIPKTLAHAHSEKVSLFVAPFIAWFSKLTHILVCILTASTNFLLKPFGKKAFTKKEYITEEDVKFMLEEGRKQGVFESAEKELIHGVFEFTDTSVKEVMVPLPKMVTINIKTPLDKVIEIISEEEFSRYPVIGVDTNDVRGILHAREFLMMFSKTGTESMGIRKIMKKPLFIPETMKISILMKEMQKKRVHMAIVIDEYGSVTGLVTLEDLLEEIVGEIRDEYDTESPVIQLADGSFIIDASISIRDLQDDYNISIPESAEYDTLGGFIVTYMQRIPRSGDAIEMDKMRLKIIEMVGQRISKVKVEFIDNSEGMG